MPANLYEIHHLTWILFVSDIRRLSGISAYNKLTNVLNAREYILVGHVTRSIKFCASSFTRNNSRQKTFSIESIIAYLYKVHMDNLDFCHELISP